MTCYFKLLQLISLGILLFTTSLMALAGNGEGHFQHAITLNEHAENDHSKKKATLAYPFVGVLLKGKKEESFWPHCTATLTKPNIVLTARHCVRNLHGYGLKVFFPFVGIREVDIGKISVFCEQSNDLCTKSIDDLAIIRLAVPIDLLPLPRLGNRTNVDFSNAKKVIGFGLNDGRSSDSGIKREGAVILNECRMCNSAGSPGGEKPFTSRSLCFDFTSDKYDPTATNYIGSQPGDSGGPMLAPGASFSPMIGLARSISWACSDSNHNEGKFVDLTNSHYHDWISEAFCYPRCVPTWSERTEKLLEIELARLESLNGRDDYHFDVKPGMTKLIFTLNHEVRGWDPDPGDLDMFIDDETECTRYVGVEVCIMNKPSFGVHTVSVKRVYKSSVYQLAAIALYAKPGARE